MYNRNKSSRGQRIRKLLARRETHLIVLFLLVLGYAGATSPYFFTSTNIFNLSSGVVESAMVAVPLALIVMAGEIDISVGPMLALSGAVFGALIVVGAPLLLAIGGAVATGLLGGLINGLVVIKLGLPSLVVTLGTYALYGGLAYVILGPVAVSSFPASFIDFTQGYIPDTPIPLTYIPLATLVLIAAFALHFTRFGRWVYFVGRNAEAARLAGVRVGRLKIWLFIIAGGVSAFAGVMLAGRLSSARADNGSGFVLDILTIVLLGGIAITGGEGTILGLVLATAIVATLRNAMTLANVDPNVQTTLIGLLLILSVAAPYSQRLLRDRHQRQRAKMLATAQEES